MVEDCIDGIWVDDGGEAVLIVSLSLVHLRMMEAYILSSSLEGSLIP